MTQPWSADQVESLAPDAASVAAGRKLARTSSWHGTGRTPTAVWGLCQGSGKNPYQTVVDLSGPAYKCSCPSRKFPCKHALGLLLVWSSGAVPEAETPAAFADEWLQTRGERAQKAAERAAATAGQGKGEDGAQLKDPEAAQRRARERRAAVDAGLTELGQWLADQTRAGLATIDRGAYARFDHMAARLVDAQCPAVASWVRSLAGVVATGEDRHARMLEELAGLYLLVRAHARIDELDDALAATVRSRIGYPVAKESVLATAAVRDRWTVAAQRDTDRDRVRERRWWLVGEASGRVAVVLEFAPSGRPLSTELVPGTAVDADLHFYPAAVPERALVGARHGDPGAPGEVPGLDVEAALARFADAVAADPWTTSVPVVLSGVRPVRADSGQNGGAWLLRDGAGRGVPVRVTDSLWPVLAWGADQAIDVLGLWSRTGFEPVSVVGV